MKKSGIDYEQYLDPVFLKHGRKVYTYDLVEKLREDNLERKRNGKRITNLIPQKGFQEKVLCTQADIKIIGGKRGGGKVLSNDSRIITPNGVVLNGDLREGDIISNPVTGGSERVLRIYEHPDHDFYELLFDDGTSIKCGLEHLWKVRSTEWPDDDAGDGYRIWTFAQIREWLDGRERGHLLVPMTAPVIFSGRERPETDPYAAGVILGGGMAAGTECIPDGYRLGSVETRLSILQGLMDTAGDADPDGGMCTFRCAGRMLAEDVRWIAGSLGGWARICGDGPECEVHIRMSEPRRLFRLPEKRDRCGGGSAVCREIVGYRHHGREDGRCISVDSPDALYMTDGFTVTHNTWVGLFEALPYIFNPDVNIYGFRKYEDDIARGIWKSSKQVFRGFGTAANSTFEWSFLGGKGATMKMEHLQDPKKVSDRFRGVEMAYILIEELAEHTRDDLDVLFSLLASNRSTSGVQPKCICTCNPVGKSNKLRYLLDWWIDPVTNREIPERDGVVRYFYRWGKDVSEMVWGDTPEEVYSNASVHSKIENLCLSTGSPYTDFITSITFISGDFRDNRILQVSDPKYMSRIAARGGESTTNDIEGIWVDLDSGSSLLTLPDMDAFFDNVEKRDGCRRASADVALTGDFLTLFAFDGHHICDMEAWRGVPTDEVVMFIRKFLQKNGVRDENFTYDSNGLGLWLKDSFPTSPQFNNKSQSSNQLLWNNLKSECAEKFVKDVKQGLFSIDAELLKRRFTDRKNRTFTLRDRLLEERRALKRKGGDGGRFEIISKPQMKAEIGHSPDFIEGIFMVEHLMARRREVVREGFENW